MCGIIGYRGTEDASEVVRKALEKLEYRGYDSAGIATVGNPSLKIEKGEGTIDDVLDTEKLKEGLDGEVGIGHTRWATHGEVNDTNAHPHTGEEEHVAVVHNGIINNHEQLKEELDAEMKSDTDTEVIPHLIEIELQKTDDLKQVCENVMEKIEGSYAVLATLKTGEMLAMKEGSPLVVSETDGEIFLGSDVTPFLDQIDSAYFFEDGDYAVIDENIRVFNDTREKDIEYEKINWDSGEASKQGYDHFMEKEIHEQSKTIKRAALQDRKDMEEAVEMIEDAERVYLTGCGTSSYAASLGAKYLRDAGYRVEVEQSHELEYRADEITEDDLVIAISQSGETADLLSLLDEVDAEVLSIVNVVGSTLDRQSEHTLYVNAGPEIGVASTKAFTAQLTVLKMIGYTAHGGLEAGRESLIDTASKVEEVLEKNRETVDELSEYLQDKENVYFIGRSTGYDVARESALKLKELSYIHAESFPGGEFKHGTLALIEEGTPVVGILSEEGQDEMMSNIAEAKSRGADIIASGEEKVDGFKQFIEVPEADNSDILQVIPFQMLAYKTSLKKGNNPDKPRNLAKSVTVK
ncbi:MAG: glucosamine--fructose-6-phosphate aminotransferase (isomerizing) [Candidatus Nanohaloarchaea archaeon]|jgi:glucosamine--fructose-6-phosphate aminotransferase (isomerizing)